MQYPDGVPCVSNIDEPFAYGTFSPHYSDDRFKGGAKTIFLRQGVKTVRASYSSTVVGACYEYNDRLYERDSTKCEEAWKTAEAKAAKQTPAFIQEYLRAYFDDPELELVHVLAGYGGNGYPYRAYGYISSKY